MANKLNALFVVMNGSHAMQEKFGLDQFGMAMLIAIATGETL